MPRILERLRTRQRRASDFEATFRYRPDDVVIVSYPKSGSTWLRFMLAHLQNEKMPDGPKPVDFLRTQLIVPELSHSAHRAGADFEALPEPRVFRSHSLYSERFPRVVYLIRDGRDALLSYYHHFKKFHGFRGPLGDFIASDLRGVDWDEHVDSWIIQNPNLSHLHLIRYESMLDDAPNEIRKLLLFMGLVATPDRLSVAIENSNFAAMRRLEVAKGLGYVEPGGDSTRFVRKGEKGGWKDAFGETEKGLVKARYGNTLIRMGYEASLDW